MTRLDQAPSVSSASLRSHLPQRGRIWARRRRAARSSAPDGDRGARLDRGPVHQRQCAGRALADRRRDPRPGAGVGVVLIPLPSGERDRVRIAELECLRALAQELVMKGASRLHIESLLRSRFQPVMVDEASIATFQTQAATPRR